MSLHLPKLSVRDILTLSLALNGVLAVAIGYLVLSREAAPTETWVDQPAPVVTMTSSRPVVAASRSTIAVGKTPAAPLPVETPQAAPAAWVPPTSVPNIAAPEPVSAASSNPIFAPDAPGNSFRYGGLVVSVDGMDDAPAGSGPSGGLSGLVLSLGVATTPSVGGSQQLASGSPVANSSSVNTASPNSESASANTSGAASGGTNNGQKPSSRYHRMLTLEQEQFRAKWGWGAYSAAQTAALQETVNSK